MAAPKTPVGRRRLLILKALASAKSSMTTLGIVNRLEITDRTALTHLRFLLASGLVTRPNYRLWQLAPGLTPLRAFDGTRLDPKKETHHAVDR